MPNIRITKQNITDAIEKTYGVSDVTITFKDDGAYFEANGTEISSEPVHGASKLTDFTVDTWLTAFGMFANN